MSINVNVSIPDKRLPKAFPKIMRNPVTGSIAIMTGDGHGTYLKGTRGVISAGRKLYVKNIEQSAWTDFLGSITLENE